MGVGCKEPHRLLLRVHGTQDMVLGFRRPFPGRIGTVEGVGKKSPLCGQLCLGESGKRKPCRLTFFNQLGYCCCYYYCTWA